MYWFARSPETETMRMRDVSGTRCAHFTLSESARAESGLSDARGSTGECRSVDFAMWVRARERAPPMRVVGVEARSFSVVESSNLERLERMAFSTVEKGRYLFAFSWAVLVPLDSEAPFMSTSPLVPPLEV